MAKKEPKTNAMRILEKEKIRFEIHRYECEEFTDGVAIADMLGQPYDKVFKTLIVSGGKRGTQVELNPADYLRVCRGSTADLVKDKRG